METGFQFDDKLSERIIMFKFDTNRPFDIKTNVKCNINLHFNMPIDTNINTSISSERGQERARLMRIVRRLVALMLMMAWFRSHVARATDVVRNLLPKHQRHGATERRGRAT